MCPTNTLSNLTWQHKNEFYRICNENLMSSLTHVTVRPLLLQSSSTFNKVVFGYENSSKGFGFKRTLEKILRNSRPAMGCFCEAIPNKGNLYKWNRVSGTLFINFFFHWSFERFQIIEVLYFHILLNERKSLLREREPGPSRPYE